MTFDSITGWSPGGIGWAVLALHLSYIVASRAGHNAIVHVDDSSLVGRLHLGDDGLVRMHP